MKIQEAIEIVYLNNEKGKVITIPEAFAEEYKIYASNRTAKLGNSARASNKRTFIISNVDRIYPKEYSFAKNFISFLYNQGYGLKSIARKIGLTSTRVRTLFSILGIEINKGNNIAYDKTREIRSENLKSLYKNRAGWFKTFDRKTNKTSRGIQGYYYNRVRKKLVWLRSTYEYIYAKWLDHHNIEWDVEQQTFQLENTTYRPDFFIYEKGTLNKIVEIKGFWDRGIVKTKELSKKLDIEIILIKDIKPYIKTTYNKEILEWKRLRILEEQRSNV
jgi:hypothetical protein